MQINNKIYSIEELKMEQNRNGVLIGRGNSGKTFLIRNLILYYVNNFTFNSLILFSKTAKFENEYSFIDNKNIFDDNLDSLIIDLINFQKGNGNSMKILFIIDDPDLSKKSIQLDMLFGQGRHWNITTIVSSQYTKNLISASIKNNMHYLLFNQVGYTGLETIYDSIFIKIPKREFFEFLYADNTKEKYAFVFYNNMGAIDDETFKLCKARFVKFSLK